jgi:hypothetical protein
LILEPSEKVELVLELELVQRPNATRVYTAISAVYYYKPATGSGPFEEFTRNLERTPRLEMKEEDPLVRVCGPDSGD